MRDLIEALVILLRYGNPEYPTHCEHDELTIVGIDPEDVAPEDIRRLNTLGFFVSPGCEELRFKSFKYGSA